VASDLKVPATIRASETPTVILLPHSPKGSGVRSIPPTATRLALSRQAGIPEPSQINSYPTDKVARRIAR
jgi:hypothetical protein